MCCRISLRCHNAQHLMLTSWKLDVVDIHTLDYKVYGYLSLVSYISKFSCEFNLCWLRELLQVATNIHSETKTVEDIEILLPVKFCCIPFNGFREVENVSANLSCVQRFQRRSRKCLSQSDAREAILFFWSTRKTNLAEYVEILLPVKFHWIPFSRFRGQELTTDTGWSGDHNSALEPSAQVH